ncbi:MAG TPA: RDD family protein [Vicinamibacterales bacterium]|nr:RDD family protein [Vicinamibacterales bacterium]
MRARLRLLWLAIVLVVVTTTSAFAQTAGTTPTSSPTTTPRVQSSAVQQPAETVRIYHRWTYGRPIVQIGQDYVLKDGETVREIRSVLADVRIEGHVEDDVVIAAGNAAIASTAVIDGSLVVAGGSATVASGAVVRRDFVVVGGTADIAPDFNPGGGHVIVGTPLIGDWVRTIVPWLTRGLLVGRLIVPDLRWIWAVVAISFLVGLLMNHLFNRQVSATAAALNKRPITAFFMGLLVLVLSGPILVIVAASVIGLAIVPFAVAALIVAALIGKIAVARVIGRGVIPETDPDSRGESLRSFVLGFVVITIAYMIPVMGLITWGLAGVFGLGCATMSFAATLRRERPAKPPKSAAEPPPAAPLPDPPAPVIPSSGPVFGAPGVSAAVAVVDLALYPRASFLDRAAALALDVVLVAIVNAVLRFTWNDGGFLIVVLLYQIGFLAWRGTTLGGVICGLRVVRANGADLRFVDALVRGLTSVFSVAALGLGCLWMLNDPERQTWHDKIAGTVVVKMPREMVLA